MTESIIEVAATGILAFLFSEQAINTAMKSDRIAIEFNLWGRII
jgi:hypothetical protein